MDFNCQYKQLEIKTGNKSYCCDYNKINKEQVQKFIGESELIQFLLANLNYKKGLTKEYISWKMEQVIEKYLSNQI